MSPPVDVVSPQWGEKSCICYLAAVLGTEAGWFFYLYLIEDVFSVSGNPEVVWQACGQMGPMRSLRLWDRGASTGVFWLWAGAEAIA